MTVLLSRTSQKSAKAQNESQREGENQISHVQTTVAVKVRTGKIHTGRKERIETLKDGDFRG